MYVAISYSAFKVAFQLAKTFLRHISGRHLGKTFHDLFIATLKILLFCVLDCFQI